jgi:hypothetical protein
MKLSLSILFALLLVACGCPEARQGSGSPAYTEARSFDLSHLEAGDGGLVETSGDARPIPWTCSDTCRRLLLDPATSCANACAAVDGYGGALQSCGFDATRSSLRCTVAYAATQGGCSCDIYDC